MADIHSRLLMLDKGVIHAQEQQVKNSIHIGGKGMAPPHAVGVPAKADKAEALCKAAQLHPTEIAWDGECILAKFSSWGGFVHGLRQLKSTVKTGRTYV